MLTVKFTSKFKKDYKTMLKRGYNKKLLQDIVQRIMEEKPLEEKYADHALGGNYQGFRECHIQPDWLLIYLVENNTLTLTLTRTGTHADLFR